MGLSVIDLLFFRFYGIINSLIIRVRTPYVTLSVSSDDRRSKPNRHMADNARVFVGGLPYSASEEDVKAFFATAGNVVSVFLPIDKETGRKRGFGFVEYSTEAERDNAIATLNDAEMGGRKLLVSAARPRE